MEALPRDALAARNIELHCHAVSGAVPCGIVISRIAIKMTIPPAAFSRLSVITAAGLVTEGCTGWGGAVNRAVPVLLVDHACGELDPGYNCRG
jgi:hypothetical protein